MKRLILIIVLVYLALPLQAGSSKHTTQNRLTDLVTILQISEPQATEFLSILTAQHAQRKALKEHYSDSRKAQRKEMKAIHQETLDKLQSILTESQIEAFKVVTRQKHRKHMNNKLRTLADEDEADL